MESLQDDIIIRSNMATTSEDEIISEYLSQNAHSDNDMAAALEYIHQLNKYDKIAMSISIQLLKSSFDLFKSNGFVSWEKEIINTNKKEKEKIE